MDCGALRFLRAHVSPRLDYTKLFDRKQPQPAAYFRAIGTTTPPARRPSR